MLISILCIVLSSHCFPFLSFCLHFKWHTYGVIGNNLTFFLFFFFFFFFFTPVCRPVKCRRLHLIYLCEYEIIALSFYRPNPEIKACLSQIQAKMSPGECPFKSRHFDGGIIIQLLISSIRALSCPPIVFRS